jgi:hypothetical protein
MQYKIRELMVQEDGYLWARVEFEDQVKQRLRQIYADQVKREERDNAEDSGDEGG